MEFSMQVGCPKLDIWHMSFLCPSHHFHEFTSIFHPLENTSVVQIPFELNSNACDFTSAKLVQTNFVKSHLIQEAQILFL